MTKCVSMNILVTLSRNYLETQHTQEGKHHIDRWTLGVNIKKVLESRVLKVFFLSLVHLVKWQTLYQMRLPRGKVNLVNDPCQVKTKKWNKNYIFKIESFFINTINNREIMYPGMHCICNSPKNIVWRYIIMQLSYNFQNIVIDKTSHTILILMCFWKLRALEICKDIPVAWIGMFLPLLCIWCIQCVPLIIMCITYAYHAFRTIFWQILHRSWVMK